MFPAWIHHLTSGIYPVNKSLEISMTHLNPNNSGHFYVLQSSFNFYHINLKDSSYWHILTSKVENSVDPGQLASQKPADLDLHCFQNRIYPGSTWFGLTTTKQGRVSFKVHHLIASSKEHLLICADLPELSLFAYTRYR